MNRKSHIAQHHLILTVTDKILKFIITIYDSKMESKMKLRLLEGYNANSSPWWSFQIHPTCSHMDKDSILNIISLDLFTHSHVTYFVAP